MNWKLWLQGLGAALISGIANGVTIAVVDPDHFNLSKAGLTRLLTVSILSGLLNGAAYIKQTPPSPQTK